MVRLIGGSVTECNANISTLGHYFLDLLQTLLGSLASRSNRLRIKLQVGATGVHVVKLRPIVVQTSKKDGNAEWPARNF